MSDNTKEIIIKSKKLNYIYECWESEVKGYPNMKLKKYVINNGYKLFEIQATYAKQLKPTKYYVLATSIKEAKKDFQEKYTWLNKIYSITEVSKELTDVIVNNPKQFSIS